MTITSDMLDEIEAGCEGVTPGPWVFFPEEGPHIGQHCVWLEDGGCVSRNVVKADAAHFARLDPQTVLALVSLARKSLASPVGEGGKDAS